MAIFWDIVSIVEIEHILHRNGLNRPEIWNLREILDNTGIPTRLRGLLVPKNELSKKYFWENYFLFCSKTNIFVLILCFFCPKCFSPKINQNHSKIAEIPQTIPKCHHKQWKNSRIVFPEFYFFLPPKLSESLKTLGHAVIKIRFFSEI